MFSHNIPEIKNLLLYYMNGGIMSNVREHLDQPDLVYKEDGAVRVFYHEQKIEITEDMFNEDGSYYLDLRDGEDVVYATIEKTEAYQPVHTHMFSFVKSELLPINFFQNRCNVGYLKRKAPWYTQGANFYSDLGTAVFSAVISPI